MTEVKDNKNAFLIDSTDTLQARLSNDQKYIIDSNGNRVEYDDPRVVIVEPAARNPYGKLLVERVYKVRHRRIRIADETTPDIIQYSKKICSGRECLASVGIAGATLKDLFEDRSDDEITLIRNPMNQHGPCQNGNWPMLWKAFSERLDLKNVIFSVAPSKRNSYLGSNFRFVILEYMLFVVGHYITEARNALQCVAKNKDSAMENFELITKDLISKTKDDKTLKIALGEWANEIKKIPLQKSVEETPKVLIIGGLNILFCHYPIENYFLDQGIIPRVVDVGESMEWIFSERAVRFGFKRGIIHPSDQLNLRQILLASFNNNLSDTYKALESYLRVAYMGWKMQSYRKIMSKSGLLFDEAPSYKSVSEEAFEFISHNGFTEASITIGRFLHAQKTGIYDGIINLGCFNCSPAMNSQAILRTIANKSYIAYAAIDVEGPAISANQRRVLETIAVQVKRKNEEKNKNFVKN